MPGPYDEETVRRTSKWVRKPISPTARARINLSLFLNEYDGLQRTVVGTDGFQTVSNAAKATIQGIELETSWLIVDGLLLQANMGLIDAELKDFLNPRGRCRRRTGDHRRHQPAVHVRSGIANCTSPTTFPRGRATLTLRASYRYVDDVESTDDNLGFPGSSYEEFDASVAYSPDSEKLANRRVRQESHGQYRERPDYQCRQSRLDSETRRAIRPAMGWSSSWSSSHGRDGSNSGPGKAPKSTDFVDELSKSRVGKMFKTALRKPYWGVGDRSVN